jgi:hypothetical protein
MKIYLSVFILLLLYANGYPRQRKPGEPKPEIEFINISLGAGIAHTNKTFILYSAEAFLKPNNSRLTLGAGYDKFKASLSGGEGEDYYLINIFAAYTNNLFPRNRGLADFYAGGGIGIGKKGLPIPLGFLRLDINLGRNVFIAPEIKQMLFAGPEGGFYSFINLSLGYRIRR